MNIVRSLYPLGDCDEDDRLFCNPLLILRQHILWTFASLRSRPGDVLQYPDEYRSHVTVGLRGDAESLPDRAP